MTAQTDVIVVGGGIAGLAAAYRLHQAGYSVLVLEQEAAPGGRMRSESWSGCQFELGAHYITLRYSRMLRLLDELGLREQLTPLPNSFRTAIWRGGRWHYLDFERPRTLLRFSAMGWKAKLSLLSAFPRVLRRGRSIVFGDMATATSLDWKDMTRTWHPDAVRYYGSPPYEVFCGYAADEVSLALIAMFYRYPRQQPVTLREGLGTVTAHLARLLTVWYQTTVQRVETTDSGALVSALSPEGHPLFHEARAVLLAVPAPAALQIWPTAPEHIRRFLQPVAYSSAHMVYVRTRQPFHPASPEGGRLYMEIVPMGEPGPTKLLQSVGFKNEHASTGGLLLLGTFPNMEAGGLSDSALADQLQADLVSLHPELREQSLDSRVVRWQLMVPKFPVGQARRLEAFRRELRPNAIDLAGDYLGGPWTEAALASGEDAAGRLQAYLLDRKER